MFIDTYIYWHYKIIKTDLHSGSKHLRHKYVLLDLHVTVRKFSFFVLMVYIYSKLHFEHLLQEPSNFPQNKLLYIFF